MQDIRLGGSMVVNKWLMVLLFVALWIFVIGTSYEIFKLKECLKIATDTINIQNKNISSLLVLNAKIAIKCRTNVKNIDIIAPYTTEHIKSFKLLDKRLERMDNGILWSMEHIQAIIDGSDIFCKKMEDFKSKVDSKLNLKY